MDYYIDSTSNTYVDACRFGNSGGDLDLSSQGVQDVWTTTGQYIQPGNAQTIIFMLDGVSVTFQDPSGTDTLYVTNVKVYECSFKYWTLGTGWIVNVTGGALTGKAQKVASAVPSTLQQNVGDVENKVCRISYTITTTIGTTRAMIGFATIQNDPSSGTNSIVRYIIGGGAPASTGIYATASAVVVVDSISVMEHGTVRLSENGTITWTSPTELLDILDPDDGFATMEDLSGYTSADPNNTFYYLGTTGIQLEGTGRNESVYNYKDFGANYFDNGYTVEFEVYVDSRSTAGGDNIHVNISNGANNDGRSLVLANYEQELVYTEYGTTSLGIFGSRNGATFGGSITNINIVADTRYYCKFVRNDSVGTYGTLYLYAYTDPERTNLFGSSSFPIPTLKGSDMRYMYVGQTYNDGGAGKLFYGRVGNVSLTAGNKELVADGGFDAVTETNSYTSDYSAGVDEAAVISGVTLTGAVDPLGGADTTWLRIAIQDADDEQHRMQISPVNATMVYGNCYRVRITYYIASGQSNVDGFVLTDGLTGTILDRKSTTTPPTYDAATSVDFYVNAPLAGTNSIRLDLYDGALLQFADAGADDLMYIKAVIVDTITFTYWTAGTGWAPQADAGALTGTAGKVAGTASDLEQNDSAVAGKEYIDVFTLTRSAGSLTPEVGGKEGSALSSSSTVSQYIEAINTGNLKFKANSTFVGTIDDVSLKEVNRPEGTLIIDWNPDFDYGIISESETTYGILTCTTSNQSLLYYINSATLPDTIASYDGANTATVTLQFSANTSYKIALRWGFLSSNALKFQVGVLVLGAWSWGAETTFGGSFTVGSDLISAYVNIHPFHLGYWALFKRALTHNEISSFTGS